MAQQARLSKIWIYPIKSLDGLEVSQVRITAGGTLENDRRWRLVDQDGQGVNGKREPRIHQIRAGFAQDSQGDVVQVTLSGLGQEEATFRIHEDRVSLENWFTRALGNPIHLAENGHTGFPDDLSAWGPTIVSEATLQAVGQWFDTMAIDQVRQRFRANLELAPTPAFWEDTLLGSPDRPRHFSLGSIQVQGMNPCLRCVVPTRHPQTSASYPHFVQRFTALRRAHLASPRPDPDPFANPYRLTVNTRIDPQEAGNVLAQGDRLQC